MPSTKGTHTYVLTVIKYLANLSVINSIDYVQENVLGQGKQDNESAFEQAKDEQISDFIRGKYESTTGSSMPIQDKSTSLDKSKD